MKKTVLSFICVFLPAAWGFPDNAYNAPVCPIPIAGKASPKITSSELAKLIDAGEVTVINALPGAKTGLPGSITMAPNPTEKNAAELIPSKDSIVVTYCGNTNCHWGGNLAKQLRALGYTNVREYTAGVQGWKRSGYRTVAL